MRMRIRHVVACVVCLAGLSAEARIRQLWTQQMMADKADLIVVAKAVEVRDTGVKTTVPNVRRGNDEIPAVDMETTFEVSAVLKGAMEGKRLVMVHLREERPEIASRGGAELVAFDPAARKEYLLYLKREADGRYSAVVGQTDPADAVKELAGGGAAPEDRVAWVARVMREIAAIKPGMIRADLTKVMREEGGLSTRTSRRYVFRECPYIKVKVEFKAVGGEAEKDEIVRISEPFLEWSIED